MKKILMTWVVAVFAVLQAQAQSSVIALLSHEGNVTTFNGATGLQKAHEAAVNGDVITLSSGTFHAVDITKGVTVRGAGMMPDTLMGTEPTVVSGNFNIDMEEAGDDAATSFEGIHFNGDFIFTIYANNVTFNKCILSSIGYYNYSDTNYTRTMNNVTIISSRVWDSVMVPNNGNAVCRNSYINYPYSHDGNSSNFEFTNCVISTSQPEYLKTSILKNCILIDRGSSSSAGYRMPGTNTVSYCIGFAFGNDGSKPFTNISTSTCWTMVKSELPNVFKTYTGTYDNYETFELTDSAAATYIGSDGTQVGMYGGSTPYTATPSVSGLQVTKFQVAPKSDSEGRLSIDIEVKTAE